MNEYEFTFAAKSGGGVSKSRVQAPSEYNARRLLQAQYGKDEIRIFDGRSLPPSEGRQDRR
jgi:hypothetical protein